MVPSLILLTGAYEAELLSPLLKSEQVSLIHVKSLQDLVAAIGSQQATARLIAFCTSVIVPAKLLNDLPGPSYNIHPGPPCYPGRHPESWAAYDGTARFGATLHEMAPRVDEGAIVDVQWVDMASGGGQLEYGMQSFRAAIGLVSKWGDPLLDVKVPLPRQHGAHWSGHKTSHAESEAMCHVDIGIDEMELARRQRAFAQVPGSRMTLALHDKIFVHTVPHPSKL